MEFTLQGLLAILTVYGYAIIFPLAIMEGPIVAVVSGLLVSRGALSAVIAFLVLVFGDIVGDTLYYIVGRWGGRQAAHRWGAYIGVTEERVLQLEKYFNKHDWKLLLFGKTQPIGATILFSAGLARMNYGRFIAYNLLGSIPKVMLFEFIGYRLGQSASEAGVTSALSTASIASSIAALLLLGAYILIRRYARRTTSELE